MVSAIPDKTMRELEAQTIDGLAFAISMGDERTRYALIAQFVQMAAVQTEAIRVLQQTGIPAAVIKGTAIGRFYPIPYLRRYGDIDILVHPDNYQRAINSSRLGKS